VTSSSPDSEFRSFMESELASELYCDEVLDGSGRLLHLDKVGSVSALAEAEDQYGFELIRDILERSEILHGTSVHKR